MRISTKIALAGVSFISLAAPAWAAEAAADDATDGEKAIIVEARRREENVQDVPQVVNAVTSATIEKLNIRSTSEITNVVPGLSLTINANGIGSSSSMRGINHDVNVSGENGTIQYYINDVPVASNFVLQAMYDIGQISVERGPQGTLRGRSTPSGAIDINWKKPSLSEVGASIQGSAGGGSSTNVQFGIGVPIINDILGVRVAGLIDRNEGNRVYSVNSTVKPSTRTESIRATVRFEPADFLKFGFVYEGLKYNATQFDQVQSMSQLITGFTTPATQTAIVQPSTCISSVPAFPNCTVLLSAAPIKAGSYGTLGLADRKAVEFTPRTVAQDFKYYAWNAEADFAGQRLIYLGSSLSFTFNPITNQDSTAALPSMTLQQNTLSTNSGSTHEIRLQNADRIGGMFDYVVGYFRQKGEPETFLTSGSALDLYFPVTSGLPNPPFPTGTTGMTPVGNISTATPIYLPKGATTEESFFGNVTAHIGDKLELSGGLRDVKFKSTSAGLYINCTIAQYAANTCVLTPGTNNVYNVSKVIYNVAARYHISDDVMVYAASGSSFRPPVRAIGDFSISLSPLELAHTSFGPETSKSYELGFKSSLMDKKVRFNATYYHQDFTNYPYRAGGAGVYYININSNGAPNLSQFNFISAVPVKVDGVEAELAYNPSRHFSISGTLSWSHSRITGGKFACTDVNKDGIPDSTRPTLAQMQTALGTEHLAECAASGSATYNPDWSGTLQAEYNLTLMDGADAYVRGLLAYKGSTQNDLQNPYDNVGSYGLINLYAGIRDPKGNWELGMYAKNISNVARLTSGNDNVGTQSATLLNAQTFGSFGSNLYSSNYRGVSVTAPREVGISLRMSFGGR